MIQYYIRCKVPAAETYSVKKWQEIQDMINPPALRRQHHDGVLQVVRALYLIYEHSSNHNEPVSGLLVAVAAGRTEAEILMKGGSTRQAQGGDGGAECRIVCRFRH